MHFFEVKDKMMQNNTCDYNNYHLKSIAQLTCKEWSRYESKPVRLQKHVQHPSTYTHIAKHFFSVVDDKILFMKQ